MQAPCLKEYRCKSCERLLFRGFIVEGTVEVKCKGCGAMNTTVLASFDDYLCGVYPCPHRIPIDPK